MLKFLRKYQKGLLVVFGVFLMVVFLAPQAIQQLGRSSMNRTVALLGDGQKVTLQQLQTAGREREAIRQFLGAFLSPGEVEALTGEDEVHWFLLTHAARKGGFSGEAGDGRQWMLELSERFAAFVETQLQQNADLDPQELLARAQADLEGMRMRTAGANRISLDQFDLALAKARGVGRMIGAYITAPRLSAPVSVIEAKEQLDEIGIDYLAIPGERGFEGEISEEQLIDHFQKYREVEPGEGEYGIGYVRPQRVKLELLTFVRSEIEEAIPISARDLVATYEANPEKYTGGRSEETPEAREEARRIELERVRTDLKRQRAEELINEGIAQVRRLVLPSLDIDPATGLVRVPEGARRVGPSLDELADRLVEHLTRWYRSRFEAEEFTMPRPTIRVLDREWLTMTELATLDGLGQAQVKLPGNRVQRFPSFVMSVRELAPQSDFGPQRGAIAIENPIRDTISGDVSFVRILDVRDRSPAESLDEVREQAERDLRSILGFEALRERIDEFRSIAISQGLDGVASLLNEQEETVGPEPQLSRSPKPPLRVTRGAKVTRGQVQTRFGGVAEINDPDLVQQIHERGDSIDPLRPIDEVPPEDRMITAPVPRKRMIVITQITGVRPLTIERFRAEGDAIAANAATLPFTAGEDGPFSLRAMVTRWNYRKPDGSDPLTRDDEGAAP